jgi:Protein of unknwon function (DUF3310)
MHSENLELHQSGKSTADERQIGGNHYKNNAIQPWTYITKNNIGYLEGNVIKYISRWREKGGIEDLRKVIHYTEKLIEIALEERK